VLVERLLSGGTLGVADTDLGIGSGHPLSVRTVMACRIVRIVKTGRGWLPRRRP
jgi:hypothetical protein